MALREDDPRAIYVQIADELRERIKQGKIPAGKKLPSNKKIAEEFQVALLTAQKAAKILEREGLVVRREGRGFIVRIEPTENPQQETAILVHQLTSVQGQLNHMASHFDKLKKLTPKVNELKELPSRVDRLEELSARLEKLEAAIAKLQRKQ